PYDVLGARAAVALLAAAVQERLQARSAADVQRADSLGPVELVRRNREQIDTEGIYVYRQAAGALYRVGVERHTRGPRHGGDLTHRRQRADLVVGGHDGDEARFGTERAPNGLRVHAAVEIDGEVSDVGAELLLQEAAWMEHRVVLRRRGDDVRTVRP